MEKESSPQSLKDIIKDVQEVTEDDDYSSDEDDVGRRSWRQESVSKSRRTRGIDSYKSGEYSKDNNVLRKEEEDEIDDLLENVYQKFEDEDEKNPQVEEKIDLDEKGSHHVDENLPEGWTPINHINGMIIYLHMPSRVCTISRPYILGTGSVMNHDIPVIVISCLQYLVSVMLRKEASAGETAWTEKLSNSTQPEKNLPNESSICKFFNKLEGCNKKNCLFWHKCSVCFDEHPTFKCSKTKNLPNESICKFFNKLEGCNKKNCLFWHKCFNCFDEHPTFKCSKDTSGRVSNETTATNNDIPGSRRLGSFIGSWGPGPQGGPWIPGPQGRPRGPGPQNVLLGLKPQGGPWGPGPQGGSRGPGYLDGPRGWMQSGPRGISSGPPRPLMELIIGDPNLRQPGQKRPLDEHNEAPSQKRLNLKNIPKAVVEEKLKNTQKAAATDNSNYSNYIIKTQKAAATDGSVYLNEGLLSQAQKCSMVSKQETNGKSIYICNVCNVNASTSNTITRHLEGQKHKKALAKDPVKAAEYKHALTRNVTVPAPTVGNQNAVTIHAPTVGNKSAVKAAEYKHALTRDVKVPAPTVGNQNAVTIHAPTVGNQSAVSYGEFLTFTNMGTGLVEKDMNRVERDKNKACRQLNAEGTLEQIHNSVVEQAQLSGMVNVKVEGKVPFYNCNVCNLSTSGYKPMASHVTGYKHKKTLSKNPELVAKYKLALANNST